MALRLRRPERADLDVIVDWMGDPGFRMFMFGDSEPKPMHMGQQALSLLGGVQGLPTTTAGQLILDEPGQGPVGLASFQELSWRNRWCVVAPYLAAEYRNETRVDEAVQTLFSHCFDELNLHRAGMRIEALDAAVQRACERLGAKRELVMRGYVMRDGRPADVYAYGVLRAEFEAARAGNRDN